ncbi:MAG: hydantoinase B/oxoprolinase family protein [Pseudomonadales bacterium]|nr:hydantoinase B/oxoprolinase family protein [Pseudomonadales bacterium]
MNAIDLAIFVSRVESICAEMGAILQRAAFSPNIKDRLDFSCALFDSQGALFAQAAHIPVHLGSMAYAMAGIIEGVQWQPGDMLVVNDPFLGGTHLPDVTMVAPLFVDGELVSFVANRAHHANIGAQAPGSMPLSNHMDQEGLLIPPTIFVRRGKLVSEILEQLTGMPGSDTSGDFAAQVSANRKGVERLGELIHAMGLEQFAKGVVAINDYGEKLASSALARMPAGVYEFSDAMDNDGFGAEYIPIKVSLDISAAGINVDFEGTAAQVAGNINCPLSVTAASVYYAFRCLLPAQTPNCAGTYRCISIKAPQNCLVNASRPAATAAGNVETSMRLVDVMLGALAKVIPDEIPAASQGTMNNVAMGSRGTQSSWDYYETIGGGMGACRQSQGLSGVQCHMTNTLNTPIESLEQHYPLRIERYQLRERSGGAGAFKGGDGLIRDFVFLADTDVTLLTERRTAGPWGLEGGSAGLSGSNTLDGELLPAKVQFKAERGQVLSIETPGGGGYGVASSSVEPS